MQQARDVAYFVSTLRRGRVGRAVMGSLTAAAAGQVLLVISGVLVARALGPEARGSLALIVLVSGVLAQVGGLGLPTATAYFAAQGGRTAQLVKLLVRPFVLQIVALSGFQIIALLALERAFGPAFLTLGIATLPALVAAMATAYSLAILQGHRRFAAFNLLRTLPGVIYCLAVAGLWVAHALNLQTAVYAWTASVVSAALITTAALMQSGPSIGSSQSRPLRLRDLFSFGLKAYVGSLYPVESFRLDQLIVGIAFSPLALGYYVVARAFSNLPTFISQSLGMVAYPEVASIVDPRARRHWLWRFVSLSFAVSALAVAAIELLLAWLIPVLFGPAFSQAVPLARVLLVGALVRSVRRVLSESLRGSGAPGAGTIAEVVSWLAALLLLGVFMALEMGPMGVAAAFAGSEFASVTTLLILERKQRNPYRSSDAALAVPTAIDPASLASASPEEQS